MTKHRKWDWWWGCKKSWTIIAKQWYTAIIACWGFVFYMVLEKKRCGETEVDRKRNWRPWRNGTCRSTQRQHNTPNTLPEWWVSMCSNIIPFLNSQCVIQVTKFRVLEKVNLRERDIQRYLKTFQFSECYRLWAFKQIWNGRSDWRGLKRRVKGWWMRLFCVFPCHPFRHSIHVLFILMSINVCDATMAFLWFVWWLVFVKKETEWWLCVVAKQCNCCHPFHPFQCVLCVCETKMAWASSAFS